MSGRVNRYELGTSEPDFATADMLAEELGALLAYLVADNDTMAQIILSAASLSPSEQRKLASELSADAVRTVPLDLNASDQWSITLDIAWHGTTTMMLGSSFAAMDYCGQRISPNPAG